MVLTPACRVMNYVKIEQAEAQIPSVRITMFSSANGQGFFDPPAAP